MNPTVFYYTISQLREILVTERTQAKVNVVMERTTDNQWVNFRNDFAHGRSIHISIQNTIGSYHSSKKYLRFWTR